jgi:hypothetical protein
MYMHQEASTDYNAMSSVGLCRAMIDMISFSIKQVTLKAKKFQEPLYLMWHVALDGGDF